MKKFLFLASLTIASSPAYAGDGPATAAEMIFASICGPLIVVIYALLAFSVMYTKGNRQS